MTTHDALSQRRASLSMHMIVALVVGVVGAIVFVELATLVLERETKALDRQISLWLYQLDDPALVTAMRVITFLGSVWCLVGVVGLVAAWVLRRGRRALAGTFVATSVAAMILNALLKLLFQRPRPDLVSIIMAPESYSFPSGHAMMSTAVYGMAAFVIGRLVPRLRWPVALAAALLVILISLSRVYLGVHWTTDVLAGAAAGALVLSAGVLGVTAWESRSKRRAG